MYNTSTLRDVNKKKIEQEQKYLTDIIGAAIMMTNPIKIMKYPYCNIFVLSSNLSNYRYNALLALYAIDRPTNQFDIFNHLYKSILTPKRVKKYLEFFILFLYCRYFKECRLCSFSTLRTHKHFIQLEYHRHKGNYLFSSLFVEL